MFLRVLFWLVLLQLFMLCYQNITIHIGLNNIIKYWSVAKSSHKNLKNRLKFLSKLRQMFDILKTKFCSLKKRLITKQNKQTNSKMILKPSMVVGLKNFRSKRTKILTNCRRLKRKLSNLKTTKSIMLMIQRTFNRHFLMLMEILLKSCKIWILCKRNMRFCLKLVHILTRRKMTFQIDMLSRFRNFLINITKTFCLTATMF